MKNKDNSSSTQHTLHQQPQTFNNVDALSKSEDLRINDCSIQNYVYDSGTNGRPIIEVL